jgi:ABC-type bacteriocin/lantibiotic exporter with double-glycine peptidase domain
MVMKNYQEALASHDVLVELTKIPTTEENPNPKKLDTIKNISLDSVEFGYSTESKILK